MTLTDAYEWAKSNMPQDIMKNTPFSNYQYNYVNDINSGQYVNSSMSLTQFDLSSIYNSSVWTNSQSHFILLPIVRTAELRNAANNNVIPLTNNSYYLTALKNLNTCLVHQVDLLLNGKTVHQLQPYTNIYTGIKLASELSVDDLKLMGATLGMMDMNNPNSMSYKLTATANYSSPSIANNYINGKPYIDVGTNTTAQNNGSANGAIQQKIALNKTKGGSWGGLEAICGGTQMENEFQSTFEIVNGQAVWKDYIVIFMKDLLDAMDKIGLVRRLDGILRIYINTGLCRVDYDSVGTQLTFNNANSTFTDTCPILINNINSSPVTLGPPDVAKYLNVGCFISRAPNYTFNNSNFSSVASPMNACRYYYNQITIQPALALDYISSNSSKSILYDGLLYNTFTNITAGGNFSQLIQSGVTNIKSVLIVPLISASTVLELGPPVVYLGFGAYKSPFDPVGGVGGHPISLQNFQVAVGGTNQLATSLDFTYENFIEQLSKFNKQSSSEYGVESGLWSREFWNNNRVYLVNVRSTEDDLNTPRNIVISFRNNSLVTIDISVFVVYEDKMVLNVSTGIITK